MDKSKHSVNSMSQSTSQYRGRTKQQWQCRLSLQCATCVDCWFANFVLPLYYEKHRLQLPKSLGLRNMTYNSLQAYLAATKLRPRDADRFEKRRPLLKKRVVSPKNESWHCQLHSGNDIIHKWLFFTGHICSYVCRIYHSSLLRSERHTQEEEDWGIVSYVRDFKLLFWAS